LKVYLYPQGKFINCLREWVLLKGRLLLPPYGLSLTKDKKLYLIGSKNQIDAGIVVLDPAFIDLDQQGLLIRLIRGNYSTHLNRLIRMFNLNIYPADEIIIRGIPLKENHEIVKIASRPILEVEFYKRYGRTPRDRKELIRLYEDWGWFCPTLRLHGIEMPEIQVLNTHEIEEVFKTYRSLSCSAKARTQSFINRYKVH
jgi:hypothetical protein